MDEKCARTIHEKSLITIHLYYRGVMKTGCECLCNVCLHKVIMYQLPSGLNISGKMCEVFKLFFLLTKYMHFQHQNSYYIKIYDLFNDKI